MKRFFAAVTAVVMALSLTACGQSEEPSGAGDLEKITFVLDWTPNTNHTGVYVAQAKGYFEEAGLDVEIVQPPDDGAEMLVAAGKAQFGVSFQDYLVPAFAQEEPIPVTAVAAVLQHNTSGIVSRAGEGMDTPAGLEGHRYATWDLDLEKATIREVMEAEGADFSKVELIPSTVTDEVSALQTNSVDAIWIFYGWAGVACEVAGLDIDYFHFKDIDPVFDFYSPVIIGSDSWMAENPDTARAFVAALSRGYEYAIDNPKEAADILMEAVPELGSNSELIYASQEYLAGEYQADASRWGEIDGGRWSGFFNWINDRGLAEDLEPSYGFTNDYLPEG